VPVNASFGANICVQAADSDAGLAALFANCAPNGCFADFDLKEEGLKKLGSVQNLSHI
jgi:invasion protein IalB